jgi:glycosyltransferase involved in cell wall biosynthesis/SAM-dependent methyltransferase
VRILVVADVSPVTVLGGAERMLWEQVSRLAARGHEVRVVSRAPDGGPEGAVVHQGIAVRHFRADRAPFARFLATAILGARRAVAEETAARSFDALHVHQPLSALGALTTPAGRRLPSLYTFHSPAPLEYRLRQRMSTLHRAGPAGLTGAALLRFAERASLRRATRIHVLSDFSATLLWRLYRVDDDRIVRIPGAVDLARFHPVPDRAATRTALGLPAGRPVLLTVRNLAPRMGLDELVRAMSLLRDRLPRALLLIGGAGGLRVALEAQVRELGLQDHVRLLGFVPDDELPDYYAAADAFVLPTRQLEGFGLVTVEALACGTPVLGTPIGATPEILAPLQASLLFRDASARAMAEGLAWFLEALASAPAGMTRLRAACRAHAEAHYGWERAIADLEALLARLPSARSQPAPALACPVCGGATTPGLLDGGRRYRVCRRCGTARVARVPSPEDLRAFYERQYPVFFAPEDVSEARVELFTSLVGRLAPQADGRQLVDVGCGGGHLLAAAERAGWRAVGTDVSREMCRVARKTSGARVVQADGGALPLKSGGFGAVTLVNVLDHLADPARTLAEARRLLREGGSLAIRVPNGAFHRVTRRTLALLGPLGRWAGLTQYPVFHVYSFTGRGLRRLVEDAGFRVVAVRNSPLVAAGQTRAGTAPGRLPPWLRRVVAASAAGVAVLSRGRALMAPSIELDARRSPGRPGRP